MSNNMVKPTLLSRILPAWGREHRRLSQLSKRVDIRIQSSDNLSKGFEQLVNESDVHLLFTYERQLDRNS